MSRDEKEILGIMAGYALAFLALALWNASCASAPVADWCATGLDAWVDGGYGENRSGSRDLDAWGDASTSRGSGSDWSTRVGVSVHWDLTGSCWDYEDEGVVPEVSGPERRAP